MTPPETLLAKPDDHFSFERMNTNCKQTWQQHETRRNEGEARGIYREAYTPCCIFGKIYFAPRFLDALRVGERDRFGTLGGPIFNNNGETPVGAVFLSYHCRKLYARPAVADVSFPLPLNSLPSWMSRRHWRSIDRSSLCRVPRAGGLTSQHPDRRLFGGSAYLALII